VGEPFGERLRELGLRRRGRCHDGGAFRERLADLADAEPELFHVESVGSEAFEDDRREERELLRPDCGSDVDGEAAVAYGAGPCALSDPFAEERPPSVAIDTVVSRAELAARAEQGSDRR